MIARRVCDNDMRLALFEVNRKYDGNVMFNRYDVKDKAIHFTLRVKSNEGPGHRMSVPRRGTGTQRRLVSACRHVHGNFFNALLSINPYAVIITSFGVGSARKITADGRSWQNINIGSQTFPFLQSQTCEC